MMELFEDKIYFDNHDEVKSILVIGTDKESCPLISVVMPVYNHPDFFEESLKSVINQKGMSDYEIIVVDNNHPDYQHDNQKIVEENYVGKIRYYVNEENIGGVGSENRGIYMAKGKYITFCHDDDLLYDDALESLVDFLQSTKTEYSAVFGNMTIIDENGVEQNRKDEFDSFFLRKKKYYRVSINDFLYKNYTNGCGSLYLRNNLISIGGFRKEFIPCPDYALNASYTYKYGAYALKKKTLKYRVSSQSDTSKAYVYLVDGNKKIVDNILSLGRVWKIVNSLFVKAHLRVVDFHLYNKWGENKVGIMYILYRVINRIQILVSLFIKSQRK